MKLVFLLFFCFILNLQSSHQHEHHHSHGDEPPSFKYSREANENIQSAPTPHSHSHHGHDDRHNEEGDHHHDHRHETKQQTSKTESQSGGATPTQAAASTLIWQHAVLSTLLVSIAPMLILYLIPDLTNRRCLLKILLAFAAGGLLGDAFLHLIPHAIDPHTHHTDAQDSHAHSHAHSHGGAHGEHHDHLKNAIVGVWVIAGILSFLCVEKFVWLVKSDGGGHTHSHFVGGTISDAAASQHKKTDGDYKPDKRKDAKQKSVSSSSSPPSSSPSETGKSGKSDMKVAGYLNLVADFAHNFTDGLAIGSSYLINKNVGMVTTMTIVFHELPHEIGDYAILIQSGCSRRKAILLQLTTAVGAMLGTVISLTYGGQSDAAGGSNWMLPFTAGGFIYIAAVSVLPELLSNEGEEGATNTKKEGNCVTKSCKILQSFLEVMGIICGVAMMFAISVFE